MRPKNFHRFIRPLTMMMVSPIVYFCTMAQPSAQKKDYKQSVLSIAYFIESAGNSVNSLNSLLKKDNYRNKITTLNNPVNNELGFSLKNEILIALKPILDKAKKTDKGKFKEVIENFLSNPEDNGISSVKKYLPALGIFSTVLSLVGNLVIVEKSITKEDLNQFVVRIQQYFSQYEKLNMINEQFSEQVKDLLERSDEIREDLKEFLMECIISLNPKQDKQALTAMSLDAMMRKYYDPQKLQGMLDTLCVRTEGMPYPPDAATSAKLLTSSLKKLQKEFESLYFNNYKQLKELIASLKNTIPNLDEEQLVKTSEEMERLYNDSRQADLVNLNMSQVDERMNTVCRNANQGK